VKSSPERAAILSEPLHHKGFALRDDLCGFYNGNNNE
jgi:hypothetical protein